MTEKKVVVVIDPISTGLFCLDYILNQNEFIVTTVWSPTISSHAKALQIPGLNTKTHYYVDYTTLEETCAKLRELHGDNIQHVVSLSEPGVETADLLSFTLQIPSSNGIRYSAHRRDKYQQIERLKEYQLVGTVRQQLVTTLAECIQFMHDVKGTCVLKPKNSAGSDSVFKIPYPEDGNDFALLQKRFDATFNKTNKMGIVNDVLIIQEFLQGEEYVIDTMSVDGVTKLVTAWKYSKISLKDSGDFVYLGMALCNPLSEKVQTMFKYIIQVLDALEIRNFAGHAEIIMTTKGPFLVEIGARPHGGGGVFIPLQQHCIGYSVVELFYASLLGNSPNKSNSNIDDKALTTPTDTTTSTTVTPTNGTDGNDAMQATSPIPTSTPMPKPRYFDEFPTFHPLLNGPDTFAFQVDIVNYNPDGIVIGYDQESIDLVKNLPTLLSLTDFPSIGQWMAQTIDCFTIPCGILLAGIRQQVEADLATIRRVEEKLFIIQPCPKPSK